MTGLPEVIDATLYTLCASLLGRKSVTDCGIWLPIYGCFPDFRQAHLVQPPVHTSQGTHCTMSFVRSLLLQHPGVSNDPQLVDGRLFPAVRKLSSQFE